MNPTDSVAASTARLPVPEWSASTPAGPLSRTGGSDPLDPKPMEFILSSNWVLRTEGLKDFYNDLYEHKENLEIRYDAVLHGFRIKCLPYAEMRLVTLVKDILDRLVQKEAQAGLDKSTKVISLEEWRKNKCRTGEAPDVPDAYLFPRDVALCDIRSTWDIPEDWFRTGITTTQLLPGGAKEKLRRLTNTAIVASSNRRTVYIGASGIENLNAVKRKLVSMARFLLIPKEKAQVVGIFFYNEGDRSALGEYRYLTDGNDRFFSGYILDRCDWPDYLYRHYPTIRQRGVIVRLNPKDEPWGPDDFFFSTVLPITNNDNTKEKFGAFVPKNWSYPAKDVIQNCATGGLNTTNTFQESSPLPHPYISRPMIENWVSACPDREKGIESLRPQTGTPAVVEVSRSRRPLVEARTPPGFLKNHGVEPEKPYDKVNLGSTFNEYDHTNDMIRPSTPQAGLSLEFAASSADSELTGGCGVNESTVSGSAECSTIPIRAGRDRHDPFEHLWREHSQRIIKYTPEPTIKPSNNSGRVLLPFEAPMPRLSQSDDKDSRTVRTTMNQKASSRTIPNRVLAEFDPNMMTSINKSLFRLMAPLKMWPGSIDFKIDLGRFCFLNIPKKHVQRPQDNDDEKHYKLCYIQDEVNKRHTSNKDLLFTRVLTSLGADANYIAHMRDDSGRPMWWRPKDGRSSIYEFTCRSRSAEGLELDFVVEIDAKKFTSRVEQFKPDRYCFPICCTKRVWDFQLTLSVSHNFDDICRRFAEDLAGSLRVISGNDWIPELEVSYDRSYDVEVLVVRTRNVACCTSGTSTSDTSTRASPCGDVQTLYISEVFEMDQVSRVDNARYIQLKFALYKNNSEQFGMPSTWYEVALKSNTVSKAFEQNAQLELGDEVGWSPEELVKSGAIDELVRKAAEMVKNMDGVGYWNDNHQKERSNRIVLTGNNRREAFW